MESNIPLIPGCYYHVFNRGNNRENIFIETRNFDYFMQQYQKYIVPVAETFAYCLLRNHFHLLICVRKEEELRIKDLRGFPKPRRSEVMGPEDLVLQAFTNFFNSYAKSINKAYHRTGSLFQKGFHRIPVTSNRQFLALIDYIHRNPQKHGFTDDYCNYPYSSFSALISLKPTYIEREKVLEWFGGREGFLNFHSSMDEWKQIKSLVPDDDD